MKILNFLLILLISSVAQEAVATDDKVQTSLQQADKLRTSSPQKFFALMDELEESISSFSDDQKEYFRYLSAYKQSITGNFKEALFIYEDILEKDLNKETTIRALASVVNSYAILGDHYKGAIHLFQLLKRADEIESKELKDLSYVVASVFYNQMGKYDLGDNFAKIVLENNPSPRHRCAVSSLIIESSFNSNLLSQNFDFVEESQRYCKSIGDLITYGAITVFKARELVKAKEFTSALDTLNSNKEIILGTNYPPLLSGYHSARGEAYFKLNDFGSAKLSSLKAIDSFSGVGNIFTLVVASKTLFEIANLEHDSVEELKYYKRYVNYEKKYTDDLTTKELIFRQAETENVEKQNRLLLLDKENTLLKTQAELSLKEAQNNQLLLALACSAVILLFLWTYRSRRIQIRLLKLAQTDALTGINNRNHFTVSAEHQLRQCRLVKNPVSFILFDLDHFKKINDSYGHQTGDWTLKYAVDAAKSVCRSNDIIGRMGGEEFALLLPNCSADKAAKIAEMCRKAIENIKTGESGYEFNITASFGVSDSSTCEYDFDKLYGCADSALYKSKSHGRNQVYQFNADEKPVFG